MNRITIQELIELADNAPLGLITKGAGENQYATVQHSVKGSVQALVLNGDAFSGVVPLIEWRGGFIALGNPVVQAGSIRRGDRFNAGVETIQSPPLIGPSMKFMYSVWRAGNREYWVYDGQSYSQIFVASPNVLPDGFGFVSYGGFANTGQSSSDWVGFIENIERTASLVDQSDDQNYVNGAPLNTLRFPSQVRLYAGNTLSQVANPGIFLQYGAIVAGGSETFNTDSASFASQPRHLLRSIGGGWFSSRPGDVRMFAYQINSQVSVRSLDSANGFIESTNPITREIASEQPIVNRYTWRFNWFSAPGQLEIEPTRTELYQPSESDTNVWMPIEEDRGFIVKMPMIHNGTETIMITVQYGELEDPNPNVTGGIDARRIDITLGSATFQNQLHFLSPMSDQPAIGAQQLTGFVWRLIAIPGSREPYDPPMPFISLRNFHLVWSQFRGIFDSRGPENLSVINGQVGQEIIYCDMVNSVKWVGTITALTYNQSTRTIENISVNWTASYPMPWTSFQEFDVLKTPLAGRSGALFINNGNITNFNLHLYSATFNPNNTLVQNQQNNITWVGDRITVCSSPSTGDTEVYVEQWRIDRTQEPYRIFMDPEVLIVPIEPFNPVGDWVRIEGMGYRDI